MPRVHLTSVLAGMLLPTVLLAGSPGATAAPGESPDVSPGATSSTAPAEQPAGDLGTWSVTSTGPEAWTVGWQAPDRLPVTADRPTIVAADQLGDIPPGTPVGVPTVAEDGRTVEVTVVAPEPPTPDSLDVLLSGQLLDEGGPAAPTGPTTTERWQDPAQELLPVDPGKAGNLPTVSSDYRLDGIRVRGMRKEIEMVGHVVEPAPAAEDPTHPLVMFLHGRHSYCYDPETDRVGWRWPCAGTQQPIPSHLGYDYIQQLLASQGYVTVSIAANGINAQDGDSPDGGAAARSQLVQAHLDQWAQWAGGSYPEHVVDLDRVVLVGHSRGGEGVARASLEIPLGAPYTVVGQVLIGPTNFARQTTPYVPTVTVLPSCDGDVSDLQGQSYTDLARGLVHGDTAMKSSVMSIGANHNFFNTEWTPGLAAAPASDDWGSKEGPCGRFADTRLSGGEQRRVGQAYVAGAVHLFADGEEEFRPMFDGSAVKVASTREAVVLSHMLGGDRTMRVPGARTTLSATVGARTVLCKGITPWRRTQQPLCGRFALAPEATPHWPTTGSFLPISRALQMTWDAPGQRGGLMLTHPLDLSGSDWLDLRTVVDPKVGDVEVEVRVTDQGGSSVTVEPVGGTMVPALPAGDRWAPGKYWAQTVRVDAADLTGIDASHVSEVELVGIGDRGRVWVIDLAAASAPLPTVPADRVPIVDLGQVTVDEGGDGVHVAEVPFRVSGQVTRAGEFRVYTWGGEDEQSVQVDVDVPVGSTGGTIAWEYSGDTLDSWPQTVHELTGHALHEVMMRDQLGRLVVLDDDPTPEVSLRAVRPLAPEGGFAELELTLSEPSGVDIGAWLRFVRGDGSAEPLRAHDLPPTWLTRWTGWDRGTDPALYELKGGAGARIRPGDTSVRVRIPVRDDGWAEPRESLTVRAMTEQGPQGDPVTVYVPAGD